MLVKSLCDESVPATEIDVTVSSNAPVLPGYCAHYIDQETQLRGETWSFSEIAPDVMDAATRSGRNPSVARGDYDQDGVIDTAFLIQRHGTEPEVAVCLSTRPRPVHYIADLYCHDSIATSEAGTRFYDYDREAYGEYDRDGIRVSCFERAGATYLYADGHFARIVDGD